jgi:hypothetical protein
MFYICIDERAIKGNKTLHDVKMELLQRQVAGFYYNTAVAHFSLISFFVIESIFTVVLFFEFNV